MARTAAKLTHVSEAMKQWCALMEAELLSWPQVTAKPMFGMVGFYRKGRMFAAIPRHRTVAQRDAVLVKLKGASEKVIASVLGDPRTLTAAMPKAGWIAIAVESIDDVRYVLECFSRAHDSVEKSRPKRSHT